MRQVAITHRETRDWSDRVALFAVKVLRGGLDLVSGYRHDKAVKLSKTDPAAAVQVCKFYPTDPFFLYSCD